VIPAAFDYHQAKSLDAALALLERHGDDGKLLAGGQSLIPAMRFRLATPAHLIDISGLAELRYIREKDGVLAIGALTRETALEEEGIVAARYPLLFDTAVVIADPLVRNRATVGGNLAHADPANDHPATMLAYNAQLIARSKSGERSIGIDDFFKGLFENALQPGEILTEIRIPKPAAHSGGAYLKMERKVGDYAISGVAVQLTLAGDTIQRAQVGLTNVSPTPMRARNAERALEGQAPTDDVLEAAGLAAAEECDPSSDLRGSSDYKRDLTRVLVKRAIRCACERAKGARA
jgi:aerobic carbon-monoxide dehydrogenase medium subunit